ncbi:hypothetical protein T484DRAFT_1784639 [Baffinella frigidus]|nr:hypothetical protein T484DRAFT_1784639 [Cryptophyta sp. CCMP2293]
MGGKADARLLEAMQGRATATARDFNPQEVANLVWALACFDTSPSQVSVLLVESMAVRLLSLREQLSVEGKSQMHQWLLFCDLHPEWRGQLPRSMQKVKEELGGAFRQAFAREAPRTSQTQADVAKQLRWLFPELEVEEEYEDPKSGYRIDSRVSGAGRVWAVEVDGPTHFLKGGSGREPSGSTLLKRRQLGELGYTAVAVPYWEWDDLEGKGEEQLRRYLQDKLRIDQVPPSSRSVPDGEGRDQAGTAREPCGTGSGKQPGRMYSRAQKDKLRSLLQDGQLDTAAQQREWALSISGMVGDRGAPGRSVSPAELKSWIARNGRK